MWQISYPPANGASLGIKDIGYFAVNLVKNFEIHFIVHFIGAETPLKKRHNILFMANI